MKIISFEDKYLSQFSYAIISNGEMALIDPARNPQPYIDLANNENVQITAIIETHPHADFISSHLELHQHSGAPIYVSHKLGAEYQHIGVSEDYTIALGKASLQILDTPGHSPDSISILAVNEAGESQAIFTGDSLFVGDCGRPDLREHAGAITAAREELAKQMYHTLRTKFMPLHDSTLVYPAHGAGSLCGKELSKESVSTIGKEKRENWSLQDMSEVDFIENLLNDQPFIPKYFPYDVAVNKKGAPSFSESTAAVPRREPITCAGCARALQDDVLIIDTRKESLFKQSHFRGAINLMNDTRFETWLGSIVNPGETFYLLAENETELEEMITRCASIGYEHQIKLAFVSSFGDKTAETIDSHQVIDNLALYTVVDVRNQNEVFSKPLFDTSIHIPLHQLRERSAEIPRDKPIVVHCAGGYRSAAGSSILNRNAEPNLIVYDLGNAVKKLYQDV
jgi:glyoxylase-like metal-dependent hydrolase (beta-lactamase superfamily II)/rhodanese-related sulfurtransferase